MKPARDSAGRIYRQEDPICLEFPFSTLDSAITPNDRFYVRNHFSIPEIDPAEWRLRVDGLVKKPIELDAEALRQLPIRTVTATLECAGNGRSFLSPPARGVQWDTGAVSTARWTGTSLSNVLELASVDPGATGVVLVGADSGEVKEEPKPSGAIPFARSLPWRKATDPDTILAWQMNGEDLPRDHGHPVRAIVPGWYAMASVKWLTNIAATNEPFNGYYETTEYSRYITEGGLAVLRPVQEMEPKAQIARPVAGDVLPAGEPVLISGAAWSGPAPIDRVDVSVDGGQTWRPASLAGESSSYAWRMWRYEWTTPTAGSDVTLMARATDRSGRQQPMQHDPARRSYAINRVQPVRVSVISNG